MSARSIPWKFVLPSLALAALLIFAEYIWLRDRQQAQRSARANDLVEEKIATARGHLRQQRWHEAIYELENALDVKKATNGDTVHPLLQEAQRGQAESLLDAACIALEQHRLNDTKRLLRAYETHPQASRLSQARLLSEDLERALSDEEAARLLARLSDEALTVFAERGQLTVDDGRHTEATRFFFRETLRRNVGKEVQKREAQREVVRLTAERQAAERVQRIARLRDTMTFQSLTTFLARTLEQFRDQQQQTLRQEAELQALFRQLGVNDAAEQNQFRAELTDRKPSADFREQIERKRTEVKRAFRKEQQFHHSDGELFDQLVDQEVDKAMKLLPSS